MDRAHRLGQRRTVNVYRLLVRGTLEEQIMSLQQFKLDVAATLVNQDNVSLGAMDTSGLLDLFTTQARPRGLPLPLLSFFSGSGRAAVHLVPSAARCMAVLPCLVGRKGAQLAL